MKKWICLVLVLSMMCYVTACGKEEQRDRNMDGTVHYDDNVETIVTPGEEDSGLVSPSSTQEIEISEGSIKIRVASNDYEVVIEDACKAGTLAYFSPWDDVVMFYGSQSKYPGLYILGEAVEGADNIRNLSGKITITKVDED